jgi:hypothetical protein
MVQNRFFSGHPNIFFPTRIRSRSLFADIVCFRSDRSTTQSSYPLCSLLLKYFPIHIFSLTECVLTAGWNLGLKDVGYIGISKTDSLAVKSCSSRLCAAFWFFSYVVEPRVHQLAVLQSYSNQLAVLQSYSNLRVYECAVRLPTAYSYCPLVQIQKIYCELTSIFRGSFDL